MSMRISSQSNRRLSIASGALLCAALCPIAPELRAAPAAPARPRVTYPVLQSFVRAAYPEEARKAGRQGEVRLAVTVGEDGSVSAVELARTSGHKDLDEAAMAAVRQFRYKPAQVDGKPVSAKILVAYPFRLRDQVPEAQARPGPRAPDPRAPDPRAADPRAPDPRATDPRAPQGKSPGEGPVSPARPGSPEPRPAPPADPPRRKTPAQGERPAIAPPEAGLAVLGGRVRERGTRRALPDAEVLVFRTSPRSKQRGELAARVFVEESGAFSVKSLAPGAYLVEVRAPGCLPFLVEERLTPGLRLKVEYFVERRSYDPYETVVTTKAERREVSVYTVALPEIQKIPGTQGDAIRSVQNMPGVARASFGTGALVVRGSAPGDTRVYLEGMEIPQLFHFFGLTSVVNSDLLKEIVFVPGNYSVQYGRAMGGIIDVFTRPAKRDRWHAYLDVDLWDLGALVEGPVGAGSIALSARRSHIDSVLSVLPSDLLGVDLTVAPVYYDYQAMLDYPLLGGNLKVLVLGSDDRVKLVFQGPTGLGAEARGVRQTTLFHKLISSWGRRWDRHEAKATLSAGYQMIDVFISDALRFELGVASANWRLHYGYQVAKSLKIAFGIDGEHLWGRTDFSAPPIPAEGEIPPPVASQEPISASVASRLYSQAVYTEATWRPHWRLTVVPGLRLDFLRLGGFEGWVFDPRITSKVELVRKKLWLNAAVGLFHQEPFFSDVYTVSGGNPDLSHTRSLHSSLGFFWQPRESISLEATGFYKHVTSNVVGSNE
ncbi:MAG: TonB family protein, partial [Polyangia bacterium]|nr:TonB family protein [Polyangia bacterium]